MRFTTKAIVAVVLGSLTSTNVNAYGFTKTFGGIQQKYQDFKVAADKVKNVVGILRRKGDPEMFRDVHLPRSMSIGERVDNLLENQISTNLDVALYVIGGGLEQFAGVELDDFLPESLETLDTSVDVNDLKGLKKPAKGEEIPREYSIRKTYTTMINSLIKNKIDDPDPCEGYMYFGNGDYVKILPMMLQSNPFWASTLIVSGDSDEYLELDTNHRRSKYSKILKSMQERLESRHVNVRFNKDMTINQITNKGEVVPEEDWNYYASAACYNVYYYSQQVHALIHVLHYLMCTAITLSTEEAGDDSMEAWGSIYDDNIAIKYYEVATLLFKSSIGDDDKKFLTGKNGFGGTVEVMKVLREFLCDWGSYKSADDFMTKFLLSDIYETAKNPEDVIESAAILTEFRKQVDLIEPYATEVTQSMETSNPSGFKRAEDFLKNFMSECGKGVSSIDSISSWMQLMSCTGLVHGSTLSYSRMTLIPEVWRWIDISNDTFSDNEIDQMFVIAATMQGMSLDRHVFTSEVTVGTPWDTSKFTPEIREVMDKYNKKSNDLKVAYQKEIEKRPDFRDYGWILTDHCPDGYDGKQYTITTYI